MLGRGGQPIDKRLDPAAQRMSQADQPFKRWRQLAIFQLREPADGEAGPGHNGFKGELTGQPGFPNPAAEGGKVDRGLHLA